MKLQDKYIAKEAFTFPLFCFICLAFNTYWGCTDGWPVGAIIGASFFGIIIICYVGKYIRCGRNYLKIDANGIEIKDWKKIGRRLRYLNGLRSKSVRSIIEIPLYMLLYLSVN